MEPLHPGDPRTVGPHQALARLGEGSMGVVLLARSPGGRLVAAKVVHPELAGDAAFRARFRREVTAARAVGGAFTAAVVDADPGAARPWLVTAYLPGHTLQEAVAVRGPLPVPAVGALGAALAEAVSSVHRAGVVHRDLKPSNVLLTVEGPRVLDFGIASAADASVITRSGTMLGSPGYMAPEQAAGRPAGPAADVFSLAGTLVYAATGRGPFGDGPAHVLLYRILHEEPDLSGVADPALTALLAACLSKDPVARPAPPVVLHALTGGGTAPQGAAWLPPRLAADLRQAAMTRPPPPPASPRAPSRRGLLIGGAAAAGVAVTGGAVTAAVLLTRGSGHSGPPWTARLGESIVGGPAVAGGVLVYPSSNGVFSGVDARTGRALWTDRPVQADLSPAAAGAGGMVLLSSHGGLAAIDPRTGEGTWDVSGRGVNLHPAVHVSGTMAFVAADVQTVQGRETFLQGVDLAGGRTVWQQRLGGLGDHGSQAGVTAAGGAVYAEGGDGFLYAVEAVTGRLRWQLDLKAGVCADPAVSGGTVLALTSGRRLVAADVATGRQKWAAQLDPGVFDEYAPPPLTAGGTAVVTLATVLGQGRTYGVDLATGAVRWTAAAPSVPHGTVAVTADTVLVGSGGLSALDPATGRVRWQTSDHGLSGLVTAQGAAHALGYDGIWSYDVRTGRELHRTRGASLCDGLTTDGTVLYWRADDDAAREVVCALPAPRP